MRFFCLIFIFLSVQLNAQYTITASSNPVAGEIVKTWQLDTLGLAVGTSGTNQVWNFTGINIAPSISIKSNSYVTVNSAPNYSLFPSANLAQTSDGNGFTLCNYSNTSIIIYGFVNNTLTVLYQNPMKLADLPFSYGTTCVDAWSSSYNYSATPVTETGTITTTSDSYGTLNTPGNSYPNVLRVKIENYKIQSAGANTNTETTVDYLFYSSISKSSLLTVTNKTLATSASSVVSISKSGSVAHMVLQGFKENSQKSFFDVYPNPLTQKEINLEFHESTIEPCQLIIYNAIGHAVKIISVNHSSEKINLSDLNSGIYFLHIKGKQIFSPKKIIIH